jgi:hypothetical protein
LREVLEAEKRRGEELRVERDRWAAQAERLALPKPDAVSNEPPGVVPRIRSGGRARMVVAAAGRVGVGQ